MKADGWREGSKASYGRWTLQLISTPMATTRDFTHFVMIIKSLIHIFDLDATNEMPSNQTRPSINYPPPIMHFQCCPSNWINLPFFPRMASFCLLVCLLSGDDTLQEPTCFRSPFTSTGNIPLLTKQSNRAMIGIDCSCSKVCQMN